MRKVYYIAGMTAAGKTTAAIQLGKHMGIPVYHADRTLDMIEDALKYECGDRLALRDGEMEFDQRTIRLMKAKAFNEYFGKISGDFVVEGFTLVYQAERALLEKVIGEHTRIFFLLDPPFDLWCELAKAKGYVPTKSTYDQWHKHFELPPQYYQITDPKTLLALHETYQRRGLTDVKWSQLKMPNSMKGETILDLGCNAGWIGSFCKERGATTIVGIDNNWRLLEDAKAAGYDHALLADLNGDWRAGIPIRRFSRVFCLAVLHYVSDKARFIKQLAGLTMDECVIEMPLSGLAGFALERYQGNLLIPTMPLMQEWLAAAFAEVEIVGNTIPPDDGKMQRFVFKCRLAK